MKKIYIKIIFIIIIMSELSKNNMNRSTSNTSNNSSESLFSDKSNNINNETEKKIYYLYNASNIYINNNIINNILSSNNINVQINNINTWQKAFVHKSYSKNTKRKKEDKYIYDDINNELPDDIIPLQNESNETLEWLGDSIIQSVIGVYLFKRFPLENEGFLTKMRSKLVKTETLSKLSSYLGFKKYIIMSQHIEINCNGRNNSRILEDTFEAFIGAMFLDLGNKNNSLGYEICSKFIINIIEKTIDITNLILNDDNYKDQLMRYCQKMFNGYFPIYKQETIKLIENDNGTVIKKFKMNVYDYNNLIIGTGTAKSKKEAEQKAAKNALNKYGLINGY